MKIYILTLLIVLSSCSSTENKQKPEEVLSNAYTNALQEQVRFDNMMQKAITSGDFQSIKSESDSCIATIKGELSTIESITTQREMTAYKDAASIAIKAFICSVEAGTKFSTLTVNSTELEFNDAITDYMKSKENLPKLIEAVYSAKAKDIQKKSSAKE